MNDIIVPSHRVFSGLNFFLLFLENFYEFIGAKRMTIAQKHNLNGLREGPGEQLTLYIRIKEGFMKSIGGRLWGREKTTQGKLLNWIKRQNSETHTSFTSVVFTG